MASRRPRDPKAKAQREPSANPISQEAGAARIHCWVGPVGPVTDSCTQLPAPFYGAQVPHFLSQRPRLLGRQLLRPGQAISPIFVYFCPGKPGEAEPFAGGHTAREREAVPLPPRLQSILDASVAWGSWLTHGASWAEELVRGAPGAGVLAPHPGRVDRGVAVRGS